jgi:hypothetical protein
MESYFDHGHTDFEGELYAVSSVIVIVEKNGTQKWVEVDVYLWNRDAELLDFQMRRWTSILRDGVDRMRTAWLGAIMVSKCSIISYEVIIIPVVLSALFPQKHMHILGLICNPDWKEQFGCDSNSLSRTWRFTLRTRK